MKDINYRNETELKKIEELTHGAPYELWMNAGGVYVVMVQKLGAAFAQALQNIFEADRMFHPSTAC